MSPSSAVDILVVCFCTVEGENDSLLGTDESPIREICWVAIDVYEKKVISEGEYHIEEDNEDENEEEDEEKENEDEEDEMDEEEGEKDEQEREKNEDGESKEDDSEQKQHKVTLEDALTHFQEILANLSKDKKIVRLVTENGLHLRQCLHRQAFDKEISLSDTFYNYFDLTMQYKLFKDGGLQFMNIRSIAKDMVNEGNEDLLCTPRKRCHFCVRVVVHLLTEGHKFSELEEIYKSLETGMTDGFVHDDTIARVRGLPWQVSDVDVADFFCGLNIERGGVALCLNEKGRRNGEALVRFSCPEHREMALKRHKHHLLGRYIEVYKGTAQEFSKTARAPISAMHCVEQFLSHGGEVLIRMRGLPFDASVQDILDFFGECPKVHQEEHGVMLVSHPDGSSTGDAFVLFNTEPEGQVALKKHRENIGKRYVELFRSTRAEMQQVLTMYTTVCQLMMNPITGPILNPVTGPLGPVVTTEQGLINQSVLTQTNMSCLRMRGIPFCASEKNILDFLSTHGNFVVGSIHIICNIQGRLSGEALVQMRSPEVAYKCAKDLHLGHMCGRYIEVFQCSVKDMACMLATSLASQFAVRQMNQLSNDNSNNNANSSNNRNNLYNSTPPPPQAILATPHEVSINGRIVTPLQPPPTISSNGLLLQNITLIPIYSNQCPPLITSLPAGLLPPPYITPSPAPPPPHMITGIPPLTEAMILSPETVHVQVNQFGKSNGVACITFTAPEDLQGQIYQKQNE